MADAEVQNYVLFLLQIHGDALMATKEFKQAGVLYYQVCKVYNRWKVNNRIMDVVEPCDATAADLTREVCEFGVDDYIRTKASYAESIMNMGDIQQAIQKFENAKFSIENEIVYENPMIYVNICNQLANCYLLLPEKDLDKALENFELSLCTISKIESEKAADRCEGTDQISPLIVAKICLNIAIIRSQLGDLQEAVYMHEKSLMYKS